jgi:SsrA-binding protein
MAKKKDKSEAGTKLLASNRSARYEYHLLKKFEAGIVLTGTEVKSAREGRVNLRDAYARVQAGEVFLHQAHFSPYSHARVEEIDPLRPRKLLLHASEIRKLAKETGTSGVTLVPTRLYLKQGKIKVEIALARGKRSYDKRESTKRREVEREIARAKSVR